MLTLTRRKNERILIGENIIVEVVQLKSGSVRLGIVAPPEMNVLREELVGRDERIKYRGEETNAA